MTYSPSKSKHLLQCETGFLFRDGRPMGPFLRRITKFLLRVQLLMRSASPPPGGISMPETDDSHRGQGPGSTEGGKKVPFEILEYGVHFAIGRFIIR